MKTLIPHALSLAKKAYSQGEVPVGALVVRGESEVIGEGYNQREDLQDPTSHAEIHALQSASRHLGSWRLEGCSMLVTLEPCMMCLATAQHARIEKILYLARDSKGGALSLGYRMHEDTRLNHRFSVEEIPTPEASELLSKFFQELRTRKKSRQSSDI
jgi:tRNA(adenine34) deaminase